MLPDTSQDRKMIEPLAGLDASLLTKTVRSTPRPKAFTPQVNALPHSASE
jgi:hypothetical protein